ncbi:tetratricopeptide repeat protein [Actinoplanes sp. NPDC000266]
MTPDLLAAHPDHPVLVYEVGGAYDTAGEEQTARGYYERALEQFPASDAVRVFRALALNEAKRHDEAVAELLTVVTTHADVTDLGRWAPGLSNVAQWLTGGRPQ